MPSRSVWFLSSLLLALSLAAPAFPAEPYLVKDVNPVFEGRGSLPEGFVSLGNVSVFSAETGDAGRELWASDGTAAGTLLLADACPGECDGISRGVVSPTPAGLFFFTAGTDRSPSLWITRGTPASTLLLETLTPGPSALQRVWMETQRIFYFAADDGVHGMEPWRTDGTPAGTFLVADVWPGPTGSDPAELTVFNGRVFFTANDASAGPSLWSTDGTPAGTRLIKDTWPEATTTSVRPRLLRVAGGALLFEAPSQAGRELWRSDGTTRGTRLAAELVPGPSYALVRDVLVLGNRLLVIAETLDQGQELWASAAE